MMNNRNHPKYLHLLLILLLAIFCVNTQDNIEKPGINHKFPIQNLWKVYDVLMNSKGTDINEIINNGQLDTYNLATYIFNMNYFYPFPLCDRCKSIQYFAFRAGDKYLTAEPTYLKFTKSSNITEAQLFIGQQQFDGTWAFKSLTQGKYLRASDDFKTINYQTYVGGWQRWYIQRHENHVHVQSAYFIYRYWWWNQYDILEQLNGGAGNIQVLYVPSLKWLWNW